MNHLRTTSWLISTLINAASLLASIFSVTPAQAGDALSLRLKTQYNNAFRGIYSNLNESGVGGVVASPSRSYPDYYYHWVRDAAVAMYPLAVRYSFETDPIEKVDFYSRLMKWVQFESHIQDTPNMSGGLGEPKFYIDGSAIQQPWGRPQNDGPALRAITMMTFAEALLAEGRHDIVQKYLYASQIPAVAPIKKDLEYIAHHWRETSYDLWEEVKGQHFYTRMVQRRAMVVGAQFASRMGDGGAAEFYRQQARNLEEALLSHINRERGLIEPTRDQDAGWSHKTSGLDIAVILGVLHGATGDPFFSPSNDWAWASANKLEAAFRNLYALNRNSDLGTAIGRYPEDVYDGVGFSVGHPWFIATHSYAEFYCRAAKEISKNKGGRLSRLPKHLLARLIEVASAEQKTGAATIFGSDVQMASEKLRAEGRRYLERSLAHMDTNGHFSEQFNRDTGFMMGARDLTWSYASFLTAYWACEN